MRGSKKLWASRAFQIMNEILIYEQKPWTASQLETRAGLSRAGIYYN